jgi:hypothetical protein
LDSYKPGSEVFPEFDEALRKAMCQEVSRLFAMIVRENRPVTEAIDASYTFLDERLARHYGMLESCRLAPSKTAQNKIWRDSGFFSKP